MREMSGTFYSNSVLTYRTRTITKKAYRTSVLYFFAKIEAYRTYVPYRTAIPAIYNTGIFILSFSLENLTTWDKNHDYVAQNVANFGSEKVLKLMIWL